jgi:2-polyprenyl-3-methyl-5-hydroxy-6-metoxy-1,4-benzoquinol methylase
MQNYERVKSDPVSAELYTKRRPRKHQFEMQMVAEAFQMLPGTDVKSVLDAPCGVGRLSLWLRQQGFEVSAVDLGEAAVQLSKTLLEENNLTASVQCQDIFNMQFEDAGFDATVCFRLLHHFSQESDQAALIKELCRVTSKYVVISYISAYSLTSLRRKLRKLTRGKAIKQNPNSLEQLKAMFAGNGFSLLGRVNRSAFLHSLQLAVFVREG